MGYKEPLPAPIPGIQATLCAMQPSEIHEYVQRMDSEALEAANGEETTLLLSIMDLSLWTRIFEFANSHLPKAMERLRHCHSILNDLFSQDFDEIDEAKRNTEIAEVAIKQANKCVNIETAGGIGAFNHPYLMNLSINEVVKASMEDMEESMSSSQAAAELETLVASGKHLAVPFAPQRSVEDQSNQKDHRVWAIGNINLPAPIPESTWRIWAALKQSEIDDCWDQAMAGTQFIKNGTPFLRGFALYHFDHTKCEVESIKLHVKQVCPTAADRRDKHPQEMWNILRPYLRCICSSQAIRACNGNVIWWDHCVWYVINHLDKFFPT
jgi:hypothetical protein